MSIIAVDGAVPRIHASTYVAEGAHIIGNVDLGEDASVWFNAVLRGDINSIHIGNRTNIQDGSIVHVTGKLAAHVGNDVTVGHRAIVHGCHVEDGSLIGMGSIILDGAYIGKQALVAAGAVVLEGFSVPDGMLAAGVPARVLRPLTENEKRSLLESAEHYVRYARSFRNATIRK